jgi:hypothetical protein
MGTSKRVTCGGSSALDHLLLIFLVNNDSSRSFIRKSMVVGSQKAEDLPWVTQSRILGR